MKTLYLCRHAKSSWAAPGLADHDRPLNDRGLRDAPEMARRFKERDGRPDLLVSSTALRAITTARIFASALGVNENEIRKEARIYGANRSTVIELIGDLSNNAQSAMFFGHEPTFTEVTEYLSNSTIDGFPTCCIARIELEVDDWKEIHAGSGTIAWMDKPKDPA